MALCSGGVPPEDTNDDNTDESTEIEVKKLRDGEWFATNGEIRMLGSSKPQVLRNFAQRLEQVDQ